MKNPKNDLRVDRSRNEEPIKRVIHADFFLANSIVGSVTHYTYVLPKVIRGRRARANDERWVCRTDAPRQDVTGW